jgi:repressor LexA
MNHLHEKQKQILEELAERHARGQSAPSTRELRALLGAKSPAVPEYHLKKLEASGYITRTKGQSRGIALTGIGSRIVGRYVPVLGSIAAGMPIVAQQDEQADLIRDMTGRGDFALHVQGDSMQLADVHDGDYAILREQKSAERGEIVAAVLYDFEAEATLKGYYPESNCVRFVPANPAYEEIVLEHGSGSRWAILGKLVGVVRFVDGMMPEAFA